MRIALALAAILVICLKANAQDIGQICAAEADAKALHGRERIRFEERCKARKTNATVVIGQDHGVPASPLCAGNPVNAFLGACPLCMLLFAFDDDSHCYVR
jgi:hypothetical protein